MDKNVYLVVRILRTMLLH